MNQTPSIPSPRADRRAIDRPTGLALEILPDRFAICRLSPGRVPNWAYRGAFVSISRTADELSVVCDQRHVPKSIRAEREWRAIRVVGTMDLSLIGVLAALAVPLTEARLGVFCVSTFDTDYLMIRGEALEAAQRVLEDAGHGFDVAPELLAARIGPEPAPAEPSPVPPPASELESTEPEPSRSSSRPPRQRGKRADTKTAASEISVTEESFTDEAVAEDVLTEETLTKAGDDQEATPESPAPEAEAERDGLVETASAEEAAEAHEEARPKSRNGRSRSRRPSARRAKRGDTAQAEPDASSDSASAEPQAVAPVADDRSTLPAAQPEPDERDEPEDEDSFEGEDLCTGAIPQDDVETTEHTFADLGLSDAILRTIERVGFKHPTPIQASAVPEALAGHDLVGLAETGSGKTAAFCLPMAERLNHGRGIRGLILCPTREIALQTKAFLDLVGQDHSLDTVCVIGGVKIGPQIDRLRKEPDIVVATPGRLLDHLERGTVRLNKIAFLVLDEADHMLDLGFLPQIQAVLQAVPDKRQTMLFSATMPPPIARLTARFMNEPVSIDFRPEGRTAAGIEHRLYLVSDTDKLPCVKALLEEIEGSTLVFTRRKIEAEWLARQLQGMGYLAERLHSDRSQSQRVQALRAFRAGKTRVLVATDVAARGLDVPRIGHVINFDFPEMIEDYVHRSGRTARGSAAGIVSSVGTWKDKITVREIERAIGQPLKRFTVDGVEAWSELPKRKVIRRRLL